jgi:hypothetical protein
MQDETLHSKKFFFKKKASHRNGQPGLFYRESSSHKAAFSSVEAALFFLIFAGLSRSLYLFGRFFSFFKSKKSPGSIN